MKMILPLLMGLTGLAAGGAAGHMLRSPAPESSVEAQEVPAAAQPDQAHEYVKMTNQFVVPVMQAGRVASLVVMSLTLEVVEGTSERAYAVEPKMRDAFLQVMFDHANTGGFTGAFTESLPMDNLRKALLEAAQSIGGKTMKDVLISEIVRQDI